MSQHPFIPVMIGYAAALLYGASRVTEHPAFWGGTVCDDTQFNIELCTGYAPAGALIVVILAFLLTVFTMGAISKATRSNV